MYLRRLAACPVEKTEITIVNDWRLAPAADPEGMAYVFFRDDVTQPWRFDFPGRGAGRVRLAEGDYSFVMYNDDTSDIIFKTLTGGKTFVTTSTEKMRLDDNEVETFEAPDMMWAASISDVCVCADGVSYTSGDTIAGGSGQYVIRTFPRQITPTYTVIISRVANLQGVVAMRGVISGMASGINLSDGTASETEAEVFFTPHTGPDSTVTAGFHTFGLPFYRKIYNELRLYFVLSDKRVVCRKFDVTDMVTSLPDPMNVEIVIDAIELPYAPPPSRPGAFDPDVVDWRTVIVNFTT